ncbi:hypothetical protein RDI58_026016 [Solanum bulbocastanum]|uniref:Uncharacterized protein n=1 Tax=Solanum bulbocastanum TaxID=147425 RepID=A0AAN8Y0H1_SOLBU
MAKSYENEHPIKAFGWATRDTSGVLSPFNFSRIVTGEKDVQFKAMYCGICHSDLHQLKNEWGSTKKLKEFNIHYIYTSMRLLVL